MDSFAVDNYHPRDYLFSGPSPTANNFARLKLSTEIFAELSPLEFARVSLSSIFFYYPLLADFPRKIFEKLQCCGFSERIEPGAEEKGESRKKCNQCSLEQLSIVTSDRVANVGTNFTKGSFQPSRVLDIRFWFRNNTIESFLLVE